MANKHLKPEPHIITSRCWWYEQDDGISVVVEHIDDDDMYSHTENYLVPWEDIRTALSRKDLPEPEKVKK